MNISQNKKSPLKRIRQGFTLLEMVIVMGIIALIVGGAIGVMGGFGESAKLQTAQADMQKIEASIRLYEMNGGRIPTTAQGLDALVNRPTSGPKPKKWVSAKKLPTDPWGNDYQYRAQGKIDNTTFEIYSMGPDGKSETEDDISSQDK